MAIIGVEIGREHGISSLVKWLYYYFFLTHIAYMRCCSEKNDTKRL